MSLRRRLCVESRLLAAVTIGVLLITAACDRSGNDGDPGGQRLKAIRADGGYRLVVPGVTLAHEDVVSARKVAYTESYFGPSATRTLTVSGPPADILAAYDERLRRLGWEPAGTVPFMTYETRTYRKLIHNWDATLSVSMYPDAQHKMTIEVSAPPATRSRAMAPRAVVQL